MPNAASSGPNATPEARAGLTRRAIVVRAPTVLAATALLGACAEMSPNGPSAGPVAAAAPPPAPAAQPAAPSAPAPVPPPEPFEQAILNAANAVFASAQLPPGVPQPHPLVIDPLVNGVTGEQSAATNAIQDRVSALVRERYAQYEVVYEKIVKQ